MFVLKVGITLIALIVTIVILIILAGISMNMLLSEDGIITKAKYAKENYKNATNQEENEINAAENFISEALINKIDDEKEEVINKFKVILNKSNGIKEVLGSGEYNVGETVTISAVLIDDYIDENYTYSSETAESSPKENDTKIKESHSYTFKNWSGSLSSNDVNFSFIMPENDVELTANSNENIAIYEKYIYQGIPTVDVPNKIKFKIWNSSDTTEVEKEHSIGTAVNYGKIRVDYSKSGILRIKNVTSDLTDYFKYSGTTYTIQKSKEITINIGFPEYQWVKQ